MTASNLNPLIDEYASLKAQIAELTIRKGQLEQALADVSAGAYESEHHRLTISDLVLESNDKVLKAEIDAVVEAYRASLSRQYITAHTVSKPSRRHLLGARTGKNLVAA